MVRAPIPDSTNEAILVKSRRRCCICFGLKRDLGVKSGQIAHLDRNNKNPSEDNLAFLCFDHHDEYDSKTSQRKGFLIGEVKTYREQLYNYNSSCSPTPELTHLEISQALAEGGRGGSGEIFGDGTVVGGRGGRVGAGGRGRGGDGGGGIVHGSGMVIGGDGGSVDGTAIRYPPARSGYDLFLAEQGQVPDWGVVYPGYGGMSGGYLERHKLVASIREKFFLSQGLPEKLFASKIDDVPISYINSELEALGLAWRAEKEGHWYVYYIP